MTDFATARANFLAKVESYAPGQAVRFAPVLDELVRWSEEHDLVWLPPGGTHHLITFRVPGGGSHFWTAQPRTEDGAKFSLMTDAHERLPAPLWEEACEELVRIGGKKKEAGAGAVPEVAFTKLIWEPYRVRVLTLMGRLLEGVQGPKATKATAP